MCHCYLCKDGCVKCYNVGDCALLACDMLMKMVFSMHAICGTLHGYNSYRDYQKMLNLKFL